MRIAHVTPVYPPKGGMGTVAHEYVEALRARSEEVSVFTPDYARAWIKWGNAAVMPSLLWKLRGYDVIHLHYPFYGGAIFTALAALIWRTPLVMTYHMHTEADGILGMIFRLYRWFIEPFIFLIAHSVLVSSFDYASSVKVTHARLVELPFSVDVERFHPGSAPTLRERLNIKADACVFLFVGGMDDAHYFKGVDVLIEAAYLLKEVAGWHVVCIGGGNKLETYKTMVEERGLEEVFHFAGRVHDGVLAHYYRAANVHILPSINRSEAFGLVTLEAGATGLPSLVSDLPGVRTLVEDRGTGFCLIPGSVDDLQEKMRWMIHHEQERASMGERARRHVEDRYSPKLITDQLQDLYRGVMVK